MGFQLNPHDPCVEKRIRCEQFTIGYYVDDNVATHKEETVLQQLTKDIEKNVGKITVMEGNKHTFLGMDVKFCDNGTMTIDMKGYVEEILQDFPDKIRSTATSPAKNDLSTVDHSSPRLDEGKRARFSVVSISN